MNGYVGYILLVKLAHKKAHYPKTVDNLFILQLKSRYTYNIIYVNLHIILFNLHQLSKYQQPFLIKLLL